MGSPELAILPRSPDRRLRRSDGALLGSQAMKRRSLGRMPAEWEPHAATWLAWPHETSDWPGKFAPIPWIYAQIIRHLARVEKVRILVEDASVERKVRRMLKDADVAMDAVEVFHHPTNRSWTR